MATDEPTCASTNAPSSSDEITPLDAAELAFAEHNRLAELIMGLVEMIGAVQDGRADVRRVDIPKLRQNVGLSKSIRSMHDCLTWLCPDLPPLDGEEED